MRVVPTMKRRCRRSTLKARKRVIDVRPACFDRGVLPTFRTRNARQSGDASEQNVL